MLAEGARLHTVILLLSSPVEEAEADLAVAMV
jgi:hypothetical protein